MPGIALEINRKCSVCGKLFRVNKLDSQVCSKRCSNIALKRRRDAEAREARLDEIATMVPDIREYISMKEAVAMFNIERGTLYRLIRLGRIPAINMGKHLIRIKRSELEANLLIRPIAREEKAKENEDQEKKEQIYNEQRKTQGIESVHQVNEWAHDYPPEIQRTIRYLGLKILPVDEPVESTHQILRTWGDALMQITNRATPAPTFKDWLLYKWQQTKAYYHNRQALAYTLLYIGGLATVVCLSLYQSAVMDLDRTNRIFYHNVIRNKDGANDYHQLDSLIHSNSFFKTYRTLDK